MNHTPTPWKTHEENYASLDFDLGKLVPKKTIHIEAGDSLIALVGNDKKANAEFIVRACNAHDELVSFVKYYASLSLEALIDPEFANRLRKRAGDLAKAGVSV